MAIFRNVVEVLRGSLLAHAISFAAIPLLSRLYEPDDFGRYQMFLIVLGFLLLLASFRYELAILNAKTETYAVSLTRFCLVINCVVASGVLVGCVILDAVATDIFAKLGSSLWLLPIAVLAGGVFQTLTYLLLRLHAFRVSSIARGIQAIGNTGSSALLGAANATGVGMVVADLVGRSFAAVYSLRYLLSGSRAIGLGRKSTYSMRHLAFQFREFPLFSLPGSVIDGLCAAIAPALMFAAFGSAVSGQFAIIDRSISMPLGVITQAVSQVFMASFSTALRESPVKSVEIYRSIVKMHLKLAVLPCLILLLWADDAVPFLLGEQWQLAGEFARIMAPYFLVSFVVGPVNMALLLLGKQKTNLGWYVFRVTLVLASWLLILHFDVEPKLALVIHVAVNIAAYLIFLFIVDQAIGRLAKDAPR